jgi:hypothetical protein
VPKDRRWWAVALTVAAPGLLFLPWLTVIIDAFQYATGDAIRQANAFTPLQSLKGALFMFSSGGVALLALFAAYSLRSSTPIRFLWFWAIGIFALLVVVNARFGVILEVRYLFPVWPALALIAAAGADRLVRAHRQPALIALGLWAAARVDAQPALSSAVARTDCRGAHARRAAGCADFHPARLDVARVSHAGLRVLPARHAAPARRAA